MKPDLSRVDFALDELPGSELHQVLDGYRDEASAKPRGIAGSLAPDSGCAREVSALAD